MNRLTSVGAAATALDQAAGHLNDARRRAHTADQLVRIDAARRKVAAAATAVVDLERHLRTHQEDRR